MINKPNIPANLTKKKYKINIHIWNEKKEK